MKLAQKTMGKKDPKELFNAWNSSQLFGVQELAKAYGEYVMVYNDIRFLNKFESNEVKYSSKIKDDTKEIMNLMFKLSHLNRISDDLGTFYENGYFTADHGEMIREEICNLLPLFKRFAISITDCLKPEDQENDCMIAPSDGDLYKSIQNRVFTAPRAFERIDIWQELVTPPKL